MSLYEYAARGDTEGVRRELAAGAAVNARDPRTGRTALMAAVESAHADIALLRLLVDHGADVNARGWTEETAPQEAAALTPADSRQYVWNGVTPLLLAASTGDIERVRYLLDAGADIRATTTHGYDALINAVYSGAQGKRDLAPLVSLLLARGARPDGKTSYGETALQAASGFAMFDVLALLLAAGANRRQLRWNPLMEAVVFGSLEDVRTAISSGTDLEASDSVGRTALHLSIQSGDRAKAQALRNAGATLAPSIHGQSSLTFAIVAGQPDLLAWLLAAGCDPNAATNYGETPLMEAARAGEVEAVRLLLEAGAQIDRVDQFQNQALTLADNPEIVRLLLAAGADINNVTNAMRKALFGIPADEPLSLPREAYLAGKYRRFGQANPEAQSEPFWQAMIRGRAAAYAARAAYQDTDNYADGAVWCFERFGRTLTALPDGRYVEIGGEHEDYYDPDFCIYNDVVVYNSDGTFTLYGYPAEVFPPTDFHSATLIGDAIYIIGSLGYRGDRRFGTTPVFRLDCTTWQIEPVVTSGRQPGWISRHTAVYEADTHRIVVSGGKRSVRRRRPDRAARARDYITPGGRIGDRRIFIERYIDNKASYALDLATLEWAMTR